MSLTDDDNEASATPGSESRRDQRRRRFLSVAPRRTQNVLDRILLLAKCGNRAVYEYTAEDVEKVFGAIERELEEARRRFADRTRDRVKFTL